MTANTAAVSQYIQPIGSHERLGFILRKRPQRSWLGETVGHADNKAQERTQFATPKTRFLPQFLSASTVLYKFVVEGYLPFRRTCAFISMLGYSS